MAEYRHALLIFTKPPIPGTVKTRLTKEKGGLFSPKRAAQFFECSLLDVAELCCWGLSDLEAGDAAAAELDPDYPQHSYDIIVSTAPAENLDILKATFDRVGPWPREFRYIVDRGSSFDEHFDDSFNQIFDMGYDTVVAVGGDIATMPREHVSNAFRWLQYFMQTSEIGGLVEAPCQECGVSLVGWVKGTPIDHQGVFYNMQGRPALDAYVQKASENNLPFAHLSPVADVDDPQDLAHTISLVRTLKYVSEHGQESTYVPRRVHAWIEMMNLQVTTPPNSDFDTREALDIPSDSPVAQGETGGETAADMDLTQVPAPSQIR